MLRRMGTGQSDGPEPLRRVETTQQKIGCQLDDSEYERVSAGLAPTHRPKAASSRRIVLDLQHTRTNCSTMLMLERTHTGEQAAAWPRVSPTLTSLFVNDDSWALNRKEN